jgi:hypothetical protein
VLLLEDLMCWLGARRSTLKRLLDEKNDSD